MILATKQVCCLYKQQIRDMTLHLCIICSLRFEETREGLELPKYCSRPLKMVALRSYETSEADFGVT